VSAARSRRYRYGPSRAFVWVVAVALAAQIVWAVPQSSTPRDTAELERVIFGEMQTERAVSDVRCTRVGPEAANCVATLPDAGRVRVSAGIDARTGAVTWALTDAAETDGPDSVPGR
jgi:hypothetical protein